MGESDELVRTSLLEIRAAATGWGEVAPEERRRRIRTYLARTAQSASLDPKEFVSRVLAVLPQREGVDLGDPASTRAADQVPAASAVAEQPPEPIGDPVERIFKQIDALSDSDRRRLIAMMRAEGLLPPEPARMAAPVPVPAAPAPAPAPVPAPVQPATPSRGGAPVLGNAAYLELLDGLGLLRVADRPGGPGGPSEEELAEIEARFAKQGFRRSALTADAVAVALAHFARAISEFSEEHEKNPRGLPEAIRQILPNISRAPVQRLKDYLAGAQGCDSDDLRTYVEEYFEPYRELSERLPRLCDRIMAMAAAMNPKSMEEKAPKSVFGTIAYDKLWENFKERYAEHAAKGFGASKEQTRAWLFRQWLT